MQSYEKLARIPIFKEDLGFLIEPPLTPPWEGGETTALPPPMQQRHPDVTVQRILPLCKGELEGVGGKAKN